MMRGPAGSSGRKGSAKLAKSFQDARNEGRRTLFSRWPELRRTSDREFATAYKEASAQLGREADSERWKNLIDLETELDKSVAAGEAAEIADSQNLRFVRLGKSVILAHQLKEGDNKSLKERYARLIESEGRTVLPPTK